MCTCVSVRVYVCVRSRDFACVGVYVFCFEEASESSD